MKLKHVLLTAGLALTMTLGVGIALAGQQRATAEPKAVEALGESYYLCGSRNEWNLENHDVEIVEGAVAVSMEFSKGESFKFHTGTSWADELNVRNLKGSACGYFDKLTESENVDTNIYCKRGGTYTVSISDGELSIGLYEGASAVDVYVQVKGWEHTYVYAYDDVTGSEDGYVAKPLGLYPGTEISQVSHFLNFGGPEYGNLGGIGKMSVIHVGGISNTKIIISDGTDAKKSGSCVLQNGAYYWNDGTSGNVSHGSIAKVAYDIDNAIYWASSESVCNISKSKAASLYAEYEPYKTYTVLNETTLWSWGNKDKKTEEKKNWKISEVAEELNRIATAPDGTRSLNGIINTNNSMMILIISSIAVVSLAGAFFIIRKRKHQ